MTDSTAGVTSEIPPITGNSSCCVKPETNGAPSAVNQLGKREREMFYLMTHSTHFIYGYMASDIW